MPFVGGPLPFPPPRVAFWQPTQQTLDDGGKKRRWIAAVVKNHSRKAFDRFQMPADVLLSERRHFLSNRRRLTRLTHPHYPVPVHESKRSSPD